MRIGSGAGYAGDRIEPAVALAEKGNISYICFECLAERTIALAQMEKIKNPDKGYGQFLEKRMEAMLPFCAEKGLVMISNIGAANPLAALRKTCEIAGRMKTRPLKIAAVSGDDVYDRIMESDGVIWETGRSVREIRDKIVSANAYLGVEAVLPALREGCNVIITGRVADPALFLAPMVHEFGWSLDDWHRLGAGTAIGHLMECAAQVSGGYFADPGLKDVPDLANVGFPIAEVQSNGEGLITKLTDAGGMVTVRTCKEQLLYEIQDPANYPTPNVTADFTHITLEEVGKDRVAVRGATGKPRPLELKVALGVNEGYIGEGEISYAGHGALARARLGGSIVRERLLRAGIYEQSIKTEIIGYNALLGSITEITDIEPLDVRLRIAVKTDDEKKARNVGEEVEALYLVGPAGAGGARKSVRPVIAVYSTGIQRDLIRTGLKIEEIA